MYWFLGVQSLSSGQLISYSDGRVTPSNITVTPKLDVRISRLDFDFNDEDVLQPFVGFSRSVNVDWSLLMIRHFWRCSSVQLFLKILCVPSG